MNLTLAEVKASNLAEFLNKFKKHSNEEIATATRNLRNYLKQQVVSYPPVKSLYVSQNYFVGDGAEWNQTSYI